MSPDEIHVLVLTNAAHVQGFLIQALADVDGICLEWSADPDILLSRLVTTAGRHDAILLDDGRGSAADLIGVIQAIKAQFDFIPIIILTQRSTNDTFAALEAGADRYLTLPVQPKELELTFRIAARSRRSRWEGKILSALQDVMRTIGTNQNIDDILRHACRIVVDLFGQDHSGVVRFPREGDAGIVVADYPPGVLHNCRSAEGLEIPVRGVPVEERLVYDQVLQNIAQAAEEPGLGPVRQILQQIGVQSILLVPVVVQGRTVASFSLDAIHAARHFSQSEVKLGQVLAAQLAVAIENARLYQALQTEQEYLQSLYRASSIIIAPREPGDVLQSVLNLAHQVTGAWRAVVLLGDAGAFPHALLSAGFAYSLDRQTSIRAYGISQQVLASGMARFVPDTQVETADVHPAMLQDGVRAAACLPLQLQGQTIGVLWLHFRETHAFSDNERRALEFYANQSAIAYDMSRRIEELEQLRSAIAAMTRPSDIRDVLQEIVSGAKTVLKADYTLIWSYDEIRDVFLPEELVAEGIPGPWLERFRQEEPRTGKTTRYILSHEYLHVPLLAEADPYVVGNPTRQSLTALGVESFHGIRLDVAGEKLGVLFADYKQPQGFTEEARRVLGTFASHAALALKKARLLDQIRKARNAAGTLAEIGVLERDVARVCDQIVRGAQDALGCDAVTLYRYDEETGELGYPPAMSSGVRYPERATSLPEVLTDSIVWQILRAAELTIIDDTDSNELTRGRRFTVDEDVRSLVGVPLRVQGRNVGVMFVNYRSNHRFTDDEITNIRLFSNQTAVIIRNAQLHEQIQRHNEALEALYQAGTIITGTLTLKRVLERILEQTLKITRISDEHIGYSYIALVEDSILHYVTASSRDVLQELRNRGATHDLRRGTPPRGIATRAALEGTTQNVNDVRADPDYIPLRVYIHSQLSVPLEVSGHVIGVLSIEHSKVGAFTSEDRRNIELLAAQAAIAIQNATRFDDLKRIKALVGTKTATDWMRMVSVAWGHAVRKKVGIAVNYLDLAEMDRAAGDDHGVRQDIGSLRAALAEIAEIPIIAPLAREDSVESVQINDLVRKHLKYRWQSEPFTSIRLQRDLQSDLDALASVRASPAWLTRALEILLDNAEQAMSQAQSPERSITVGTKLVDNMIEISVRDTGPGIDAALLPRLGFDPVEKQPGTRGAGLGLLQAKLITQTYGGDLNVYSEPTGATLVIVLPIELPV